MWIDWSGGCTHLVTCSTKARAEIAIADKVVATRAQRSFPIRVAIACGVRRDNAVPDARVALVHNSAAPVLGSRIVAYSRAKEGEDPAIVDPAATRTGAIARNRGVKKLRVASGVNGNAAALISR